MDCRELDKLLYPYLDGELVEGDRVAVETHLAACDGCRASFDREHQTLLLIRSRAKAAIAPAPETLRTRLADQLADEARARRNRTVTKLAAAAAPFPGVSRATQHLFIVNPIQTFTEKSSALMATHPDVEDRIARLRNLGG